MFDDFDYRFCVNASLQVLKEERERLYEDTVGKHHIIYSGLYETKSEIRNLYFQYYLIEWLDEHWNNMRSVLINHPEYSIDQRKQFTLFFAKYYSNMIDNWKTSGELSNLALPNLLKAEKETLRELIQCTEKWEENSNMLRLMSKQHKAQFEYEINHYEEVNE